MSTEKGSLSIHSENLMPIIKKWLYSDSDIFVREMVSNASDAITKLKKLADIGEAANIPEDEAYSIRVRVDKEARTITFEDNGIGMTAEEIKQYINQIAFSGASDFLTKYQEKLDKDNEIIGHFGLGFYSVFMVAERVEIDSLSYQDGAAAAHWVCDGGADYELSDSERTARGTLITLHIGEDGKDFLEEYKLRSILVKYCNFMPVDIYLEDAAAKPADAADEDDFEEAEDDLAEEAEADIIDAEEAESDIIDAEEAEHDDGCECGHDHEDGECECGHEHGGDGHDHEHKPKKSAPKPINDTHPLWLKPANECTEEEYKAFYHKVFTDFNDPLFWIHLNMDYPFRLKGILFFPKMRHDLEYVEGQVKLYNNQVFVADNIKEVIPEFLLLLKGVMDCPDLPLNVSRSFLQNDGYVSKMSGYISRKVADKLNTLFKNERDTYTGYWEDISPFIKYGCIKEKDFYDKVKGSVVYKTTAGDFQTLAEFTARNEGKTGKTVYYVTNEQQQAQYIKLFKDQGLEAVILTTSLDNPFISYVEGYESGTRFQRIDSDITDSLKGENHAENDGELQDLFRKALANDKLAVKTENLKSPAVSAVILLSEQSRRMREMSRMFGDGLNMGMFEDQETLVLNSANPLVHSLLALKDQEGREADVNMICEHIYDLAMLGHKPLDSERMTRFIERSNEILERVVG